jgi:CubicO group peptidase (beta-lactamase class C family)
MWWTRRDSPPDTDCVRPSNSLVRSAAEGIVGEVSRDPVFCRTSHVRVVMDGRVIFDRHLRGPRAGDVFSVTKSVLATLVGAAVTDGLLADLDAPLDDLLAARGTASAGLCWRDLLTMRRGAAVLDSDDVMAHPHGWLDRWRSCPRLERPGRTFRYDDGAAYLLAAALHRVTGDLGNYADRRLFGPLGVGPVRWLRGPEGFVHGAAHLQLTAEAMGRLGMLWLDGGRAGSTVVVDPDYLAEMLTPSSTGGPPENVAFGFLTWLAEGYWFAGGWAGQHIVCVPGSRAVVVVTGDPEFTHGPPRSDAMPSGWRPTLDLVRARLLPLLVT